MAAPSELSIIKLPVSDMEPPSWYIESNLHLLKGWASHELEKTRKRRVDMRTSWKSSWIVDIAQEHKTMFLLL